MQTIYYPDQESVSAIYVTKKSRKSSYFINRIQGFGVSLYVVKALDEMVLIVQERRVKSILFPQWDFGEQELQQWITSINGHAELSRFSLHLYLLMEKKQMEMELLTPWQGSLVIPPDIFDRPSNSTPWQQLAREVISMVRGRPEVEVIGAPSGHEKFAVKSGSHKGEPQILEDSEAGVEDFSLDNKESALVTRQRPRFSTGIVYVSHTMQQVVDRALLVAPTDATVLVTGDSGTGKELIADLIHHSSRRSQNKFLRVNCAAIAPTLIESELFGYEKGAFTGASQQKMGYFEASHGGTLFLDEIGEIDLNVQAKLLRVLEYGELLRVGSISPMRVDVRIIAATNRDLKEEVAAGRFREDLYYRLNVVQVYVPPLKERREDIPPLFNFFVQSFNDKYGKNIDDISLEARRVLLNYPWPGNVRELKNTIEGLVVLKRGRRIELEELPASLQEQGMPKITWGQALTVQPGVPLRDYEREIIKENLRHFHGNRKKTAEALEISQRTLYRKIKEYQLERIDD